MCVWWWVVFLFFLVRAGQGQVEGGALREGLRVKVRFRLLLYVCMLGYICVQDLTGWGVRVRVRVYRVNCGQGVRGWKAKV